MNRKIGYAFFTKGFFWLGRLGRNSKLNKVKESLTRGGDYGINFVS